MPRILLDMLRAAALPVYDVGDVIMPFYVWEEPGEWNLRYPMSGGHILLNQGVDCIINALPGILEALPPHDDPVLFFTIRQIYQLPAFVTNAPTLYVAASLASTSSTNIGQPLNEDDDPVAIIASLCQATFRRHNPIRGIEVPRQYHPYVQLVLDQREDLDNDSSFANVKAKAILYANLTPKQLSDLDHYGHFHVRGQDGYTYRLIRKSSHNVCRIVNGQPSHEFCLTTSAYIPIYDLLLTQKLHLEANTRGFLETANTWDVSNGQRLFIKGGLCSLVDHTGSLLR